MLEIIKKLAEAGDVSSRADIIKNEVSKYCDSVSVDDTQNIIVRICAQDRDARNIAVLTHMDCGGFLVNSVNSDGLLCVTPIGGADPAVMSFAHVRSGDGAVGVLVPGDAENSEKHIDIGAETKEDALNRVKIGDVFIPAPTVQQLSEKTVCGSLLSVCVPCAVLAECAKVLSDKPLLNNVSIIFIKNGQYGSVLSSVGTDLAVCVGATATHDEKTANSVLLRLCDKSFSSDKVLSDVILEEAERAGLACRPYVSNEGSSRAALTQAHGVPSAQLDIPVKYMGSVSETVSISNAVTLRDTVSKFLRAKL